MQFIVLLNMHYNKIITENRFALVLPARIINRCIPQLSSQSLVPVRWDCRVAFHG